MPKMCNQATFSISPTATNFCHEVVAKLYSKLVEQARQ